MIDSRHTHSIEVVVEIEKLTTLRTDTCNFKLNKLFPAYILVILQLFWLFFTLKLPFIFAAIVIMFGIRNWIRLAFKW